MISFSNNARENQVEQFICNDHRFGFFLHFSDEVNQQEKEAFSIVGSSFHPLPCNIQHLLSSHLSKDSDLRNHLEKTQFSDYSLFHLENKQLLYLKRSEETERSDLQLHKLEEEIKEIFTRYAKPGTHVLNIEGDIGINVIELSANVQDHGTVHLFEPNLEIFCLSAINAFLHDCKNVKLSRQTIGLQSGMTKLDDLGIQPISLIRIGGKTGQEVIQSGIATIKRDHPVLLVKILEKSEKLRTIKEIEDLGYFSIEKSQGYTLFIPMSMVGITPSSDGEESFHADEKSTLQPEEKSTLQVEGELDQKPIQVSWEGTFLDVRSLSVVNRFMTEQLFELPGIQLRCIASDRLGGRFFHLPELRKMLGRLSPTSSNDTQVTVRHDYEPNWKAPAKGKWVLIQPWEWGALLTEWVTNSPRIDEFWVPSHINKRMYVESGIPPEKVFVIPNGIDPSLFHPGVKPYTLPTKKKFKFLFIGALVWRKGPDILLDSYLKTFTSSDDVCLVIKDLGTWTNENDPHRTVRKAQSDPDAPEIIYLNQETSIDEIASIYAACDCLVQPYRGEGFAMPVLEAMACGIPVVTTAQGATDDFVDETVGWKIPSKVLSIGDKVYEQDLIKEGWILDVDRDVLSVLLRWLADHPTEVKKKGLIASEHAKKWTWHKAAEKAAERLKILSKD